MLSPQGDQLANEAQELRVARGQVPVDPAHLIVLTPGVVITALRPQELVTRGQHWHPLRQEQRRQQILRLPPPESQDFWVVCLPLDAAVPTVVEVRTIAIGLAVGLVVFLVVRNQVPEREAVVARNEVY